MARITFSNKPITKADVKRPKKLLKTAYIVSFILNIILSAALIVVLH